MGQKQVRHAFDYHAFLLECPQGMGSGAAPTFSTTFYQPFYAEYLQGLETVDSKKLERICAVCRK
jgi:hypothetical protein